MKTMPTICLSVVAFGIGFAAGNFVLKKKYEKRMEDAIESVKKVYSVRKKHPIIRKEEDRETVESREARKNEEFDAPEIAEFCDLNTKNGYTDYSACCESPDEVVTLGSEEDDDIKIVSNDEFEEIEDYRTVSLSYYHDDILADEGDNIVSIPEAILGDFTPGELLTGSDTAVYLRNDRKQIYIEIVKDDRMYYGDIVPDDCEEEEEY